jgi:hypothetical protein
MILDRGGKNEHEAFKAILDSFNLFPENEHRAESIKYGAGLSGFFSCSLLFYQAPASSTT